jgi:hypothetical protein
VVDVCVVVLMPVPVGGGELDHDEVSVVAVVCGPSSVGVEEGV